VSDFVGGDDDAGEAASVLDDGNAVDLLQSLVDDASATDVGETGSSSIAIVRNECSSTHVQFCDGDGDVVDGQASFLEKIFAHVGQRRCRIDGVAADAVLLKVRRRVASPGDDDASDADANFGSFEEFVAEIDAVPEGHEIFLDLGVVAVVQPVAVVVDDDEDLWVDGSRSATFAASVGAATRSR